jgi:hypothetical protein
LSNRLQRKWKRLDLLERQDAIERRRKGIDKNGFSTDKNDSTFVAGGELATRTGIFNFLRSAGVDDEAKAREIASQFADERGDIRYVNNPGQRRHGGDAISIAALRAAESYTFAKRSKSDVERASSNTVTSKHIAEFKFPDGSAEQFGMASEEDAARLAKRMSNLHRRIAR